MVQELSEAPNQEREIQISYPFCAMKPWTPNRGLLWSFRAPGGSRGCRRRGQDGGETQAPQRMQDPFDINEHIVMFQIVIEAISCV